MDKIEPEDLIKDGRAIDEFYNRAGLHYAKHGEWPRLAMVDSVMLKMILAEAHANSITIPASPSHKNGRWTLYGVQVIPVPDPIAPVFGSDYTMVDVKRKIAMGRIKRAAIETRGPDLFYDAMRSANIKPPIRPWMRKGGEDA